MTETVYPEPLLRKMLALEGPGGAPVSVDLVAPTVVTPGEPFAVKVAVLDEFGYPSLEFGGKLSIRCTAADPKAFEIAFAKGSPAVGIVTGVALPAEGTVRFEAEFAGEVVHSNPVVCETDPARRIYWGDPHVHTVLSDCHPDRCRSIDFAYAAGRWVTGLDFCGAADHVSNGRTSMGKWRAQIAAADLHDDPPAYVTVPTYEVSLKGGCGGDTNVFLRRWTPQWVDEFEEGNARTLAEKVAEQVGEGDFFVVPHHTTRTGKHGEIPDEIYPGAGHMPVVEISSKWGTSEYRGNPNPLKKIHPGPSYVVDLLNRGLRLGFIGGTDTHASVPAGFGREHLDRFPAMTAACTDRLSRDGVFDAIRTRRCYAASLERIYLDATVAGERFGQVVKWPEHAKPREIAVTAAAGSDIVSIDIVRNGETIHTEAPNAWQGAVRFADTDDLARIALESPHLGRFVYYYVRVTCASGAQAWCTPVWFVL